MSVSKLGFWKKLLYHLKSFKNKPFYSKEEKSILAHYIDCDGGIASWCAPHPRLAITFTSANKDFANFFLTIAKIGRIAEHKRAKYRKNPTYDWIISSFKEILFFLSEIEPYLVLKRKQAQKAIRLVKSRIERGIEEKAHLSYSDEEIQLIKDIRCLNQSLTERKLEWEIEEALKLLEKEND